MACDGGLQQLRGGMITRLADGSFTSRVNRLRRLARNDGLGRGCDVPSGLGGRRA